ERLAPRIAQPPITRRPPRVVASHIGSLLHARVGHSAIPFSGPAAPRIVATAPPHDRGIAARRTRAACRAATPAISRVSRFEQRCSQLGVRARTIGARTHSRRPERAPHANTWGAYPPF